jgi:flagellar hook protein FlgE
VVAAGETVGAYATALQNAVNAAGILGVTVTATAGGQLSISGANVSASGAVIQDPIASANASGAMPFDANGNLVSPASDVAGISFALLSDGAATLNMTWDLYGNNGKPTISQIDQTSAVASRLRTGMRAAIIPGYNQVRRTVAAFSTAEAQCGNWRWEIWSICGA